MEQLKPLGRAIPVVLGPTTEIYSALLTKNAAEIKKTTVETHAYGSHPRQQLDLYTPASKGVGEPKPILIFLYGGGFVNGEKNLKRIHGDVAFANLGHFFCENFGFDTIVMDYRLVSHGAAFPSGGEDLDGALQWVQKRYNGSGRKVFVMGTSAGGIHACTWLFDDAFRASRRALFAGSQGVTLAGVVPLGAAFTFRHSSKVLVDSVSQYLGSDVEKNAPLGCIARCKESGELQGEAWPRLLILDSELDPEDILQSIQDVLAELKGIKGLQVDYRNIKGHNHISPPLALGTRIAEEESWGFAVGKWCLA
jgi:acetyl esterase/lipase